MGLGSLIKIVKLRPIKHQIRLIRPKNKLVKYLELKNFRKFYPSPQKVIIFDKKANTDKNMARRVK